MSLALSVKSDDVVLRKIIALDAMGNGQVKIRISEIVRRNALDLVSRAKALVPISTGALRRSIQMDVFAGGLAAVVGSFLPYAARQEFDASLNHKVRPARRRVINTKAGLKGSIIKGTAQTNPDATWGFLRKGLRYIRPGFLGDMNALRDELARSFEDS